MLGLAAEPAATKRFETSRDMTPAEADALEARIANNSDDWDARERLVTYYRAGRAVPWERKVPGLRRHALWLIDHHPEHDVHAPPLSPEYDPEGFAAAVGLWETHLRGPGVSPYLVYHASQFFVPYEAAQADGVAAGAVTHALETLRLAAERRQDPAYSSSVATAHCVLSAVAMRDGDRELVLRHLQEAVTVPASEEIAYSPSFGWLKPVNCLLKAGERARVVEFLEAYARLSVVQRGRLLRDAQQIREGRMPAAYQSMVAHEAASPGVFIRERTFDPSAVRSPAAATGFGNSLSAHPN